MKLLLFGFPTFAFVFAVSTAAASSSSSSLRGDTDNIATREKPEDKEKDDLTTWVSLGDTDPSTRKPNFCISPDFACYKTSPDGFPPCCLHYENCPLKKPGCDITSPLAAVGNSAEEEDVASTSVAGVVNVDDEIMHLGAEERSGGSSCGRGTPPPYSCQCCFYAVSLDDWCCYYSDFGLSWTAEPFNPPGCDSVDNKESAAAVEELEEASFLRRGA